MIGTFIIKDGKLVKLTKWDLFWRNIKFKLNKYKIIDITKYSIIDIKDINKIFALSNKEYEESNKIRKEKGSISYEFYPCGGIGWGVKIHILDTGEVIDISDVESW